MFKKTFLMLVLILLVAASIKAFAAVEATKMAVGETVHFTIDKDEAKDFAIQLGASSYYVICDIKRVEEKPDVISGKIDLLKTNGSMVTSGLLRFVELDTVARVGKKFTQAKPLAARFRFTNNDEAVEVWMRVVPVKNMKFIPYSFDNAELKPLGVGTNEGKGGSLDKNEWAFHSIKLPAGKYDVSLYFKQADGENTNMSGLLLRMDSVGIRVPDWRLSLIEIGKEARVDKRLVLTKPQNVIFQVTNSERPCEYTIGIEKASD